jgi:SOS-response transcriptional repressor LexA
MRRIGMRSKSSKPNVSSRPEWATRISDLRSQLDLSQTSFGQKLQSSAMAVSRWERGVQEPPSHSYIEIGNLAGDSRCWYFWGRAGLRSEDVLRVMPGVQRRLRENAPGFEIVIAGSGKRKIKEKQQVVAVPLLQVVAGSHGGQGDDISVLHDAPVDSLIAAPKDWCPNPASTSCLRVRGESMAPTIGDDYIVAVDSAQIDRSKLDGKIVIAWNKDRGLTVSRFKRFDHVELLQPDNPMYETITLNKQNSWKVVAKVLWWIGKAP